MGLIYTWQLKGLKKQQTNTLDNAIIGTQWKLTGANEDGISGSFNGATPFVFDSTKSLEAARAAAVKSAKAKATSYAKLMGVKLGKVNYLVENSAPTNYTPVMAVAKAESDATVIDLGQQDVSISVTVQWSLL